MNNKRTILTAAASLTILPAHSATITLVDYNDGNDTNGIHDITLLSGDFGSEDNTDFTNPNLDWQEIAGGSQVNDGINTPVGTDVNSVLTAGRINGLATGHILQAGDFFTLEYYWRDASNWDNGDHIQASLFYTDDNLISGVRTEFLTLNSGNRDNSSQWETEATTGTFTGSETNKNLFLLIETEGSGGSEFARVDNVFLSVETIPEPSSSALLGLGGVALMLRRRK